VALNQEISYTSYEKLIKIAWARGLFMSTNFDNTLGHKIKIVREQLGLTLEQLTEKIGFNNYQSLSAIENGTRKLKAAELAQIAKVLHKDISFFLSDDAQTIESSLVLWREYSNTTGIREKEEEFRQYCINYYDVQTRLGLDSKCSLDLIDFDISDLRNYSKVNRIAYDKANQLQLGSRPACVLRKVLEDKYNVKVFYLNLNGFGSAASAKGQFGAAILINSSESEGRQNYNIAHELFHIITWEKFQGKDFIFGGQYYKDLESTAEAFASVLLMPETEIRAEFSNKVNDEGKIKLVDLVAMAHEFIVSIDALLWRLVNLGLLDREAVRKLLSEQRPYLNAVKAFSGQANQNKERILSDNYVYLCFKAFKNGIISKSKLATYLSVNVASVSQALSYFGFRIEDDYNEELDTARC
jgi:Zn-dependent peptidase ImmA (M78 family)/transcriptional regulator with XRE-family HTH domain